MGVTAYQVPPYAEETYRVMQHLVGRSHPVQEAISVWGDIACESCDYVLAPEGSVIKVGDQCKRCGTKVLGFLPLKDSQGQWINYRTEEGKQVELALLKA